MQSIILRVLVCLVLGCTIACGSEIAPPADAASDTADTDTAEAGTADLGELDASIDVEDAAPDLATDAERDVGPDDAALDPPADTDAPSDVAADSAADTSVDPYTELDAPSDVERDVVRPPRCGDGVVDPTEECDDGNEDESDTCLNDCTEAACGDGILNRTFGEDAFIAPIVADPAGVEGYVCDDGGSCPAGAVPTTCDVGENPNAPEHGICQALGFEYATEVTWGGGPGGVGAPMLHALNWECFDYSCVEGAFIDHDDNCFDHEMLAEIRCEGIVAEECDQGGANSDAPDACRPSCVLPFCGDGIVDSGEECDDGNRVTDDGCSVDCLLPQCGDGVTNGEEECDDGNDVDEDGCRNTCAIPTCGDGVVSDFERNETLAGPVVTGPTGATGHVCDDGATCPSGACSVETNGNAPEHGICEALGFDRAIDVRWGGGPGESDSRMPHAYNWTCRDFDCTPSTNTYDSDNCGSSEMLNTITCFGGVREECDLAGDNSDAPGATCRTDCLFARCGDRVVDPGEECDDGNHVDRDGCNDCLLPVCGDGIRETGEECDTGDARSDTARDACRSDCRDPHCGDGVIDTGEACDDANEVEEDGCNNRCQIRGCGDGLLQVGEQCDDGNLIDTDTCRIDCTWAACGDRVVQPAIGEECDDGEDNADERDRCRLDCLFPYCGDGIVDTGESCDDGNRNNDDGCTTLCEIPGCGDGVVSAGEECDDGNEDDFDACRITCEISRCGDGVVHTTLGEECDDGNTVDDDRCTNTCLRGPLWTGPPPRVYSEDFVSAGTPVAQCEAWDSFRTGLEEGYSRATINGSLDAVGATCTDPVAVNQIAAALRASVDVDVVCDGRRWTNCGSRYRGELWIDPPSLCAGSNCPDPGIMLRPCIGNVNWGGVGTATCNPPSQRMSLRFD